MVIYNGFAPGESRFRKVTPSKKDKGHGIVAYTTKRPGHAFAFTYGVVCECGKVYRSTRSPERALRTWTNHKRKETTDA